MATINVGQMIKNHIDQKFLSRTDISKRLGFFNTAIYGYEKRSSIYTTTLLNFCHVLQHNFFMDIAVQLPNTYTQNNLSEKDLLIESLKKENEKLQLENNLMKELLSGK